MIDVYIKGHCMKNPGGRGVASSLESKDGKWMNVRTSFVESTTIIRINLQSVILGLESLPPNLDVNIYTDLKYISLLDESSLNKEVNGDLLEKIREGMKRQRSVQYCWLKDFKDTPYGKELKKSIDKVYKKKGKWSEAQKPAKTNKAIKQSLAEAVKQAIKKEPAKPVVPEPVRTPPIQSLPPLDMPPPPKEPVDENTKPPPQKKKKNNFYYEGTIMGIEKRESGAGNTYFMLHVVEDQDDDRDWLEIVPFYVKEKKPWMKRGTHVICKGILQGRSGSSGLYLSLGEANITPVYDGEENNYKQNELPEIIPF